MPCHPTHSTPTRPFPASWRRPAWLAFAAVLSSAPLLSGPAVPAPGSDPAPGPRLEAPRQPELFDDVAAALSRSYYDRDFRDDELPELVRRFRPQAEAAATSEEERDVVRSLLAQIPASHLALYSRETHAKLMAELSCEPWPTLGFQVIRLGDDFFVDRVLAGGPAEDAGLRRGDRVIEIDGVQPLESSRLDWTSDDAALPDPPQHGLLCEDGEAVEFFVERSPGVRSSGVVVARSFSSCEAARTSVRIVDDGGRFGYVHLWFIAAPDAGDLIGELIAGPFADCDGLMLDLRGRGGSASEVRRLTRMLASDGRWGRPVVLLTDRGTRSAKEVIAYQMQEDGDALVVGERTAGAVIPASFKRVGLDGVLMFPQMTLGRYTRALEGRGVTPDIEVLDPLAYSDGADPIFEAGVVALQVWTD